MDEWSFVYFKIQKTSFPLKVKWEAGIKEWVRSESETRFDGWSGESVFIVISDVGTFI